MFITKTSLPRRTFLRGVGATVALPRLEAMVPARTALAQSAAAPVKRFGFIYVPHGADMASWTPATVGTNFTMSPTLTVLDTEDYHLFNMNASWRFNERMRLRGGIDNLLNEDPANAEARRGLQRLRWLQHWHLSRPLQINPLAEPKNAASALIRSNICTS